MSVGMREMAAVAVRAALEAKDAILETLSDGEIDAAVDAVLDALMEPSDRMVSDGAFQIFRGERITEEDSDAARRVWRAMLRTAAKSGE